MKALLAGMLREKMKYLLGHFRSLLMGANAASAADVGITLGPLTASAAVREALLPSPTIFDDEHTFFQPGPTDRAEYLYLASQGQNASGRSTNIPGAFASALAQGNYSGGVGVTSWIGGSPSLTDPDALEQLAAHATWTQDFTNDGAIPIPLSASFQIRLCKSG